MSLKVLVSIIVAFLFLVSGACSFDVSVSGGDSGSSFADKLKINADEHECLLVNSVVSGAALMQDASGSGDLHKSFATNNHNGERTSITADVVGSGYWEYYQPEIYTDATSATVTGFSISATDAESINCAASAADRRGDRASAGVQVTDGSLINYNANAYAYADGVYVQQHFDWSSGKSIFLAERAANPTGFASTLINVEEGSINGYADWVYTFATLQSMQTDGHFLYATGRKIASESTAYKSCGYRSDVKMNIVGLADQDSSLNSFYSLSGEGFYGAGGYPMLTGAMQGFYDAQGNLIDLSESSIDGTRDTSGTSIQIRGADDQPGYLGYYWDWTESLIQPSTNNVFAENNFGDAFGDSIYVLASSSNKRSDRASADARLIGDAKINYGGISSTSTPQSASAGNSLNEFSANYMDFTAFASSYAMGSATVHSNTMGGSGSISNNASADSSAKTLIAGQEATVRGPAFVQGDAQAINAIGIRRNVSGYWLANFTEDSYLRLIQNATVISGAPGYRMRSSITSEL